MLQQHNDDTSSDGATYCLAQAASPEPTSSGPLSRNCQIKRIKEKLLHYQSGALHRQAQHCDIENSLEDLLYQFRRCTFAEMQIHVPVALREALEKGR